MVSIGRPMFQVGSNIFELIEFTATKTGVPGASDRKTPILYGVNVAKVREVIRLPTIVPCLTNAPEVLGVFNLRGLPIPAIHLAKALGYDEEPVTPTSQVIVTEFSSRRAGFVVAGTRRIRRVSWDKVLPPSSDAFNTITGMMLIENQDFIFILDFERILLDIEGRSTGQGASGYSANEGMIQPGSSHGGGAAAPAQQGAPAGKSAKPLILVVDDSPTARRAICEMLRGMQLDIIEYTNGESAWKDLVSAEEGSDLSKVQLIVSDVEMPKLDGYSLVKRIRNNEKLKKMPIILHSSLTGDVNRDRAKQAGADAYVGKLNRKEIVEALKAALPPTWTGAA
ncbi:chemotaxis protein [Fluviispira multicolorata]|uniref:Response regulator n=1 Tax=Fluviispira multicolorata TaxID=2654512 RepID=A0A833JEY1_9BACT|nr:chemotaxis protein [Fluviispira multicolorata]KAB8033450.1 response regulator [Fluviispira multicolorata]